MTVVGPGPVCPYREFEAESGLCVAKQHPGQPRSVMSIRRGEVIAEPGWIAAGGGAYVDSPPPPAAVAC